MTRADAMALWSNGNWRLAGTNRPSEREEGDMPARGHRSTSINSHAIISLCPSVFLSLLSIDLCVEV